jgi:hypothetical protein
MDNGAGMCELQNKKCIFMIAFPVPQTAVLLLDSLNSIEVSFFM